VKRYVVKIPKWIKMLFPKRLWSFSEKENVLYLTFDDGPIPNVTPWVLEQLKQYNAKATFFCIGKNVEENPDIFKQLLAEGHAVGNHTHNHLNASNYSDKEYVENVLKAQAVIEKKEENGDWVIENTKISNRQSSIVNQKLFRPPYGRLSSKKAKKLLDLGFRIIMWDVLSADFDATISKEKCLNNVLNNAQSGSIIIFHDSIKAEDNLRHALPRVLAHFSEKGYVFKAIT